MSGASAAAIRAHYDAGDDFFALFLDETRTYSCALFTSPAQTLENAQRAKMDWHLDQARVSSGARLLDIGCGWGGLMARALEARGAAEVTGLTLSESQAAFILENGAKGARVLRQSWAVHTPTSPYDAIISVGAFEHFAQPFLDRATRIGAYEVFFRKCAAMLGPGGRLSLQTIAYPPGFDRARYDSSDYGAFVRSHIFPESDLPDVLEILEAATPHFELEIARNDRRHYAETTRRWRDGLRIRRKEAVRLVGEARVANLERYFRISIGAFDLGNLELLRLGFRRRRHDKESHAV